MLYTVQIAQIKNLPLKHKSEFHQTSNPWKYLPHLDMVSDFKAGRLTEKIPENISI